MKPMNNRKRHYHYTSLRALKSILRDGHIRTSRWHMDGHLVCNVAWTSKAPIWEPTAKATSLINNHWEFAVDDLLAGDTPPIARIEVDPGRLQAWLKYFGQVGVDDCYAWHLAECGIERGADPNAWAISQTPIPASSWLVVEIWDGHEWLLDTSFASTHGAAASRPRELLENAITGWSKPQNRATKEAI